MDKVKAFYCLTKDCIIVKFEKPLPLKGERGKKLSLLIKKELIKKNLPIYNWMPIIFMPTIPKEDGIIEIDLSSVLLPSWKLLKTKLLSQVNK